MSVIEDGWYCTKHAPNGVPDFDLSHPERLVRAKVWNFYDGEYVALILEGHIVEVIRLKSSGARAETLHRRTHFRGRKGRSAVRRLLRFVAVELRLVAYANKRYEAHVGL